MKTRSTHQRGWVESRKRKNGKRVFVIRWHERDPESAGGWRKASKVLRNCPSKKAAQRELERRMREVNQINSGLRNPQSVMTFADFADGPWVDYQQTRRLKSSTCYSYDSMLRTHLLPGLGGLALTEIAPATVSRFFSRLRRCGLSAQYERNIYAMLRTMFEVAVENELVSASPIKPKLHRPKIEDREGKPTLSRDEWQRLIQAMPLQWRPLLICTASTGLRAGELLALRWQDLDLLDGRLQVRSSLWRGRLQRPKTRASRRSIPLPESLMQTLQQHRRNVRFKAPQDFIFHRPDGSPCDPNFLRKQVLYPAMDRAKIRRGRRTHGFHLFRHTAASIVSEKIGLKHAQKLLGHSRIDTTADIYVHLDEDQTRAATEAVCRELVTFCPPSCPPLSENGQEGSTGELCN